MQTTATLFTAAAATALLLTFTPAIVAEDGHQHAKEVTKAIAILVPTKDSKVQGTVTFTKVSQGIQVEATVTGLTVGKHGFHIHEYGDLRSADGSAAGGHYNPTGEPHGGPGATKKHVGDLGNITAETTGPARYSGVLEHLTLEGKESILGRGIVVHAKADDLLSQPSGDAGDRVAVGVIGVAKTK